MPPFPFFGFCPSPNHRAKASPLPRTVAATPGFSLPLLFCLAVLFTPAAQAWDNLSEGTVIPAVGVNLRDLPSTRGTVIRRLPAGSTVEILGRYVDPDRIEGRNDFWFKVRHQEARGWVFGGFLKFSHPRVRTSATVFGLPLMKTGRFHQEEIEAKTGEEWIGLFPGEQGYVWKTVPVVIRRVKDEVVDSDRQMTGKEVQVPGHPEPLFLVKGMAVPTRSVIRLLRVGDREVSKSDPPFPGRTAPDTTLYDGTEIRIELGSATSLLRTRARPSPLPNAGMVAAAIFLTTGSVTQELLTVENYDPQDPQMKLVGAGDLDGDGKLDLLLDESNHYNLETLVLFLSSQAAKGELLKRTAYFERTGC